MKKLSDLSFADLYSLHKYLSAITHTHKVLYPGPDRISYMGRILDAVEREMDKFTVNIDYGLEEKE